MNCDTVGYLIVRAFMQLSQEGLGGAELAEILTYPKNGRIIAVGIRLRPHPRCRRGRFVVVMDQDTPKEDREYILAAWGVGEVEETYIPPPTKGDR